MKIYQIMFSPTGGTAAVSRILAEAIEKRQLNAERAAIESDEITMDEIDLACVPHKLAAELAKAELSEEDLCIVSVPSYKGRVPALAIERLRKLNGHGAAAVEVVVYGNREQEDTLIELQDTLAECGFVPVAAITAIAEHSMVRTVAAGRPDEQDRAELHMFAGQICERIHDRQEAEDVVKEHSAAEESASSMPVLFVPGNRPYKQIPENEPCAIEVGDDCVYCGVCADSCPAGAIPTTAPDTTDGTLCIGCMRCVAVCPQEVRRLTPEKAAFIEGLLGKFASGRKENILYL